MSPNWPAIIINCDSLFKNLVTVIAVAVGVWHIYGIWELRKKEKQIFNVKEEIDTLEEKTLNRIRESLVTQSQLEKMVAKERKPLERRLKTLKLERRYFLDKFPLVGFFKK